MQPVLFGDSEEVNTKPSGLAVKACKKILTSKDIFPKQQTLTGFKRLIASDSVAPVNIFKTEDSG